MISAEEARKMLTSDDELKEKRINEVVDQVLSLIEIDITRAANPERLSIDIIGLPEGFREVKDEMKYSILSQLEMLLPQAIIKKFTGYKFSAGPGTKDVVAKDISGIASIPEFILKFDNQDKLQEIVGKKPVGSMNTGY
jgi:hypothetical protein